MQWDQTRLLELTLTNRENARFQINVLQVESGHFADAQPGNPEQAENRSVGVGKQSAPGVEASCLAQHGGEVLVGIDMRPDFYAARWQQGPRGDVRVGIEQEEKPTKLTQACQ
jgi:hypothetical protein